MIEVKDRNDLLDHREHFLDNCGSVSSRGRKEQGISWAEQLQGPARLWGDPHGEEDLSQVSRGRMPPAPGFCLVPREMNELHLPDVEGPGMNSTKSTTMTAPFIGHFGSMAE